MGGNQYAVATDDALIVDSKVIKLNTVKVEYDLNDLMKTIKFKTLEGPAAKADISFKPKAQTVNSLNLLLIK